MELLQKLLNNESKNRNSFAARKHKRHQSRKNTAGFENSAGEFDFTQKVKPGCLPFRG